MAFQSRAGDIIALDNKKAGALVMSTSLASYRTASTDPIHLFARRDAFRTVAELIASSIAGVPFNVYERDEGNGRQRLSADEDVVAAALESPLAGISQFRWVEALQLDMVLHDRWAVLLDYQPDGRLELVRLPGEFVSFAIDSMRRITHVVVTNRRGKKLSIPADKCIYDVGYDPFSEAGETSGYAVAATLAASATELDKGARYRELLLDNGPKVPMYISRPIDAPQWSKSGGRDRFVESFRGYSTERAGEVPLLEDGMKLEAAPQLSAGAVEYRETRLAAQIEFAIAMHIPPELVGYRGGTNSNLESLREQLYVDVLGGRISAFRQAINAGLRRAGALDARRYVEENLAIRLASSPEKQATVLQTQVGAPIRTVNEARKLQNLPPVEGGDELIVPLNVVRGGLASPTDTVNNEFRSAQPRGQKAVQASEARFKAATQAARRRFADDLAAYFKRQRGRVTAGLGSDSSPKALADAFDEALENSDLTTVLFPHSYQAALIGASLVLDKWNPDHDGFDEAVMQPWLAKAATSTAERINGKTVSDLSEAVFSGAEWTVAVSGIYDHLQDAMSDVWAQTVSTSSTSFGSADAAKASGLKQKTWRQSASKNPRASHAALDGETVAADELFSNGARWPGDPILSADDNADCHCRVEYSRGD